VIKIKSRYSLKNLQLLLKKVSKKQQLKKEIGCFISGYINEEEQQYNLILPPSFRTLDSDEKLLSNQKIVV
jgi:hypothetical protein